LHDSPIIARQIDCRIRRYTDADDVFPYTLPSFLRRIGSIMDELGLRQ
jgi:hypothetical protein